MSIQECCVLGCGSSKSTATVHKFPKDPCLFAAWRAAISSSKIATRSDEQLHRSIVCHRHFKDDDVVPGGTQRKLKKGLNIVPSLNLPSMEAVYVPTPSQTSSKISSTSTATKEVDVLTNSQPSCSHSVDESITTSLRTGMTAEEMRTEGVMRTPPKTRKMIRLLQRRLLHSKNTGHGTIRRHHFRYFNF